VNGRAVAARTVRAHASVLDEARCGSPWITDRDAGARFNLVDKAGIADDYEVLGVGAGIRREIHASTGFAHPCEVREAVCAILDCREVAPVSWIARVIGAFIAVVAHHGWEVTRPVHVGALVIGARVVVVADDVLAEVLSALAGHTNARTAIEGAIRSVDHRNTHTLRIAPPTIATAMLVGAFVAVVRAEHASTGP
jgi:hypothetical protein